MIRIDLLPQEYKRSDAPKPAQLFASVGLAMFFGLAAAGVAYAWFGIVGGARADVSMAKEVYENKKPQAEYSDRLEAEKKEYTERLDHIKTFSDSRILWTKKLDQLASMIDSPADQDRHNVWLSEMSLKLDGGRDNGLRVKGKSATSEVRRLSNFHHDLSQGEFFKEFESISNPAGKVVTDEEFEPSAAWEFEFMLGLRGKDEDAKSAKKPAAGAAKAAPPVKK